MKQDGKKTDIKFRCDCPFTSALDVLGDKWILVLVKQMLVEGKRTFKEFTECDEAIASNILSTKLKQLEDLDLVLKTKLLNNKKSNIYLLTEKGLTLIPLIVELAVWSDVNLRTLHPSIVNGEGMTLLRKDKAEFARLLEQDYRKMLAEISKIIQDPLPA